MPNIGVPELLIVLVILIFLFGASRITDVMGSLGRGIGEWRKAINDKPEPPQEPK